MLAHSILQMGNTSIFGVSPSAESTLVPWLLDVSVHVRLKRSLLLLRNLHTCFLQLDGFKHLNVLGGRPLISRLAATCLLPVGIDGVVQYNMLDYFLFFLLGLGDHLLILSLGLRRFFLEIRSACNLEELLAKRALRDALFLLLNHATDNISLDEINILLHTALGAGLHSNLRMTCSCWLEGCLLR